MDGDPLCVLCRHPKSEHEEDTGFCSHGLVERKRGCGCIEFIAPQPCPHCGCSLRFVETSKTERLWKCDECRGNYGTPLVAP